MTQRPSGVTAIIEFLRDVPGQVHATILVPGNDEVGVDLNERGEFISHPDDVSLFHALLLDALDDPEALLVVEHADPDALQDATFLYGFYFRDGRMLHLPGDYLREHYGDKANENLELKAPPTDWFEQPADRVVLQFRPQPNDD